MTNTTLIYDLQIVNAVPDRRHPPVDGITYCAGWDDHAGMGISVICCYDYATELYATYPPGSHWQFAQLMHKRSPLVGFNNLAFDNRVLTAAGLDIPTEGYYDLRAAILASLGDPYAKGISLDALARANLGRGKSGDGALAPVLWQRGRRAAVAEYCHNDVTLTRGLWELVRTTGRVLHPVTKGYVEVS